MKKFANCYKGLNSIIVKQVRYYAYKLKKRLGYADIEDIEQDLMLCLLEHAKTYDPTRAKFSTFANYLLVYKIKDITEKLISQKNRCWACRTGLIEHHTCLESYELLDTHYDPTNGMHLAIDLNRVESLLTEPLASLLGQLKIYNVSEISRLKKIPRSTLSDLLKKLRAELRKYEFHHYK